MSSKHTPPAIPHELLPLAEVARRLTVHPKTLRRLLPALMEREPRLKARKIGRSLMFTEADYDVLVEAMAWRPPAPARLARVGSIRSRSTEPAPTAQEALRERLKQELAERKRSRRKS
jgi:hypothetical protein